MSKFLDRHGLFFVAPWERPSDQEIEARLRANAQPPSREPALALSPQAFELLVSRLNHETLQKLTRRLYDECKTLEAVRDSQRAYIAAMRAGNDDK